MGKTVMALIPAYNEENTMGELMSRLHSVYDRYGYSGRILVVSDGSTDRSASIAREYGAEVLENSVRMGKTGAVINGMQSLLKYKYNTGDAMVILDADLQLRPEDIPIMIAPLKDMDVGMVVGDRDRWVHYSQSVWFRRLFDVFLTALTGNDIDHICGFRAMPMEVAKMVAEDMVNKRARTAKFCIELALASSVLKHGYDIRSVGIPSIQANKESSVKPAAFIPQVLVTLPELVLYSGVKDLMMERRKNLNAYC